MRDNLLTRLKGIPSLYLAIVVAVVIVFFSLTAPTFFSLRNALEMLESYSVTGIFATGLLVVLVTGGIDISFLATASVVQYLAVQVSFAVGIEYNIPLGIFVSCLIGAIIGVFNGFLIYYIGIISIIVTISMQNLLYGLLMYFSNGRSIYNLPDWMYMPGEVLPFDWGGQHYRVGIAPIVFVIVLVVAYVILKKFKLGRQLYAMGGNQEAARRLGVNVALLHFFAYGFMGALAALGGITQVYRMGEVVPNALVGKELDVLAAVVLGGASLTGGKGTVFGMLLGVFLVAILKNGLLLYGVSSYFSEVVIGLIFIAAIIFTHYGKRRETLVGFG